MSTREKPDDSQNCDEGGVLRRDFILDGVKVTLSFLALEALGSPLCARSVWSSGGNSRSLNPIDLNSPPANLDDSLDVIAAYLVQYAPPTGTFPANGAWKATYDVIEWMGSPSGEGAKFSRRNRSAGRMVVTRRPASRGAGVAYNLDHAIAINGFESTLRSTMNCSVGPLPGLIDWKTDYEMHSLRKSRPPMKLGEKGWHRDGELGIAGVAGTRKIRTDRPVVPQWAVLDALRGTRADPAEAGAELEFDLLHNLTSYRPRQVLKPCGLLEIALDGRAQELHGFVQTGPGTQPTHYWIDSLGRPLLVTGGLLSSALVSVTEI